MSLPDWNERSGEGGFATMATQERIKDTPLLNLERRLKSLSRSELQTPPQIMRRSPIVVDSNPSAQISKTHGRHPRSDPHQLSTIISQRDLILHKDLELTRCLTEVKSTTNHLSNLSEVMAEIESHITSTGGLDTKVSKTPSPPSLTDHTNTQTLLKLIQPLKSSAMNTTLASHAESNPPRELLIVASATQKLYSDFQSLLQVLTQCLADSSRTYQEQLAHARERSNLGTRHTLQAEKAVYHTSLLNLKEQHAKELRDLAEQNMAAVLESESRIRALTLEFDELRANSELVHELKQEVRSVEERVQRAVEKTREEERARCELKVQEVRAQCQQLLKEADDTLHSRQRNLDESSQVRICCCHHY
jgi:ElaB/YqjD/DUF883 family membrane-anchored ribosome-binding protein